MHFSITQQDVIAVAVVLFVLLLAAWSVANRRRTRRTGRTRSQRAPQARRTRSTRRTDHGARIAVLHGKKRSSEWPRVEKEHRLHEPACVACGYQGPGIQVHHVRPFHLHPNLELDPRNLITLCEI